AGTDPKPGIRKKPQECDGDHVPSPFGGLLCRRRLTATRKPEGNDRCGMQCLCIGWRMRKPGACRWSTYSIALITSTVNRPKPKVGSPPKRRGSQFNVFVLVRQIARPHHPPNPAFNWPAGHAATSARTCA